MPSYAEEIQVLKLRVALLENPVPELKDIKKQGDSKPRGRSRSRKNSKGGNSRMMSSPKPNQESEAPTPIASSPPFSPFRQIPKFAPSMSTLLSSVATSISSTMMETSHQVEQDEIPPTHEYPKHHQELHFYGAGDHRMYSYAQAPYKRTTWYPQGVDYHPH